MSIFFDYSLFEGTVQFMFYSPVQCLKIGELNKILLTKLFQLNSILFQNFFTFKQLTLQVPVCDFTQNFESYF